MIYLDHAASTPVDPAVAAAMQDCLASAEAAANPSAVSHLAGRAAAALVDQAAAEVAGLVGATAGELVWTSGATEADNLAIIGAARFQRRRGRHLVTCTTEHPAVRESARLLEREGHTVTWLTTDAEGRIDPATVEAAIRDDTTLVSVMHVNNETGVIQDIEAIGSICRHRDVLFHVDAAQAAGRLPIDVRSQHIDLLSLSAHKLGGPQGIGALFLDRDRCRRVEPLLHGGGQQRGLRPGTLPVHQVVGMGCAFSLAANRLSSDVARMTALRDHLWAGLGSVGGVLLNGHPRQRACHIVNVSVVGVEGESLRCAMREVAVAGGSACASESGEPSAVLLGLGRSPQLAESSLRFSLGRTTTSEEIDQVVALFGSAVGRLRALVPVVRTALA